MRNNVVCLVNYFQFGICLLLDYQISLDPNDLFVREWRHDLGVAGVSNFL